MPTRTQAVLVRLVPTVLFLGFGGYILFGPNGVSELWVNTQLASDQRKAWAELENDNDRLLLEVQQLQNDPIHMERLVADELGLAREGATLYYFDDDDASVVREQ